MKLPRRVFLPFALCLWAVCAVPGVRAADSVESLEKAAQEWVRIRAETVRLEADWSVQKELLTSTVNALTERAQTVEDKRDEVKAKSTPERDELAALQARNQATLDGMQGTEARLKQVQARLLQLRPALPPRLSDALTLAYQTLADAKAGPAERLQTIMTILNRCAQFNRVVTYDEEILALEGETQSKSLPVLYWGLSHAYALDRTTGRAWLGAPGANGWQWSPHPEAAAAVAALMAVHHDKAEPRFVAAPARLAHPAATTASHP